MPPVLTKNGDQLELALAGCRGMEFNDAKEKIKEVPGRRWDPESKNWIVPADPQVADRILKTIRPQVADDVMDWIIASRVNHEETLTAPLPEDAAGLLIPWAYKRAPWQPEVVNDDVVVGLTPWQRVATDVIAERHRAILADDMGLGKTLECISAVEEFSLRNGQIDGPKLIVAPNSVKGVWARELHRWLEDPEVVVIAGSYGPRNAKPGEHERLGTEPDEDGNLPAKLDGNQVRRLILMDAIERNAWIIVNWEQLRIEVKKEKKQLRNGGWKTVTTRPMKEPLFEETEWLAVIADEVHRAKNRKAKQTLGLWRIVGKLMIGATGTPIMNSPDELWAILRWLWPAEYHELGARRNAVPYQSFFTDYVDFYEDHFKRKVITGVKNPDALRFTLKDKLIRRTASLLGLKGRKRIRYDVPLNPKQQKLYDEAETSMWLAVEKDIAAGNKDALEFAKAAAEGASPVTLWQIKGGGPRMVRLQQIIENSALLGGDDDSAIMDDFEQKFTDSRPEPWVFWFKFKESCEIFATRLRSKYGANVGVFTGDTPAHKRTQMEDAFQRGELDALVGTIPAMGEGVTLTRAHLTAFGTRDFVPDKNEQAETRLDRKGQRDLVRVYIPEAVDTVATGRVAPINRLKEQIVRTVLPKHQIKEEVQ